MATEQIATELVVLGAGPGGYAAAFHAADLGMDVTLVDRESNPGGVCLYRGCIPSKALLHVARLLHEAQEAREWGIDFGKPKIDLAKLREWKNSVVAKLTGGLGQLARGRKVRFLRGQGSFADPTNMVVVGEGGATTQLSFEHAIVASGSRPVTLRGFPPFSERVMDSTEALEIGSLPANLLVVGGGYIGLELGSVYAALGSQVSVVEVTGGLLPGCDEDLVKVLARRIKRDMQSVMLETRVVEAVESHDGVRVRFARKDGSEETKVYDKILVAVGRKPCAEGLGLERTGVEIDASGFIKIDAQRRTAEASIFAIGDVAGGPMLAHKASHEARVAVEAIAGKKTVFAPAAIPAVVFTDPEIAWCGLTENEAARAGRTVEVARFPWAASGRATAMGIKDGLTKLVIDPETERVLGIGIVGVGAGELIGEATLAIEMGATAADLDLTIHAHPTLAETIMEAAAVFYGHATHVLRPAKREVETA